MQACSFSTFHGVRQWTVVCEEEEDVLPLIFNYCINWLQANPMETLVLGSTATPEQICQTFSFSFFQSSDAFTELRSRFSIFYLKDYESFITKFSTQWKRPVQCLLFYNPVKLTDTYPASRRKVILSTILAVVANKVPLSIAFGGSELLHARPNVVLLRKKLKPHGLKLLQILHTTNDALNDQRGALLVMSPRGLLTCYAIVLNVDRCLGVIHGKSKA